MVGASDAGPSKKGKPGAKSARPSSSANVAGKILSHRPVVTRQQTVCTRQDLTKVGFTSAQADGVTVGRNISSLRNIRMSAESKYMGQLHELKAAGFTPTELNEAGFPAKVLRGAGFELDELMQSGATLDFLIEAGFRAPELMRAGYTAQQLRGVGVDAGKLRREAHVSFPDLRDAGFTGLEFRESGFGPGDLKEAGFGLKDIRDAGFTAAQLGRKAGFTLQQLRKAGYTAGDILATGGEVTADEMLEAGFSNPQIKAAFKAHKPPAQKSTKDGKGLQSILGMFKNKPKAKKKPVRIADDRPKQGLEGLLASPPSKTVEGPSGQTYSSTSLCLRPAQEPRRTFIFFVESPFFDPIVLVTIICNCITMAWESPLDPPGTWKAGFIDKCEAVYLAVFTIEMFCKIFAFGFVSHRNSYLRDPWCQLDFVVVTLAWVPILTTLPISNFSVIRSVRALRPLRALKRVPGMPMLVQSVLEVIPKMGSVSMLCAFVFFVFGIVGMELFKGQLHYRCDAAPGSGSGALPSAAIGLPGADDTEQFCNPQRTDQCESGQACAYFQDNLGEGLMGFDSTPQAFLVLLQVVTFDDWATSMYALMQASSGYVVIYYILCCMIGGFFVLNLFLAVIFEEFVSLSRNERATEDMENREIKSDDAPITTSADSMGAESDKTPLLRDGERQSEIMQDDPTTLDGPDAPSFMTRVATSDTLNNFSLGLVVLNMLLMCMPYQGMSEQYASTLEGVTSVITFIFILEMVVKLLGLGCADYWSDGWNALDGTIVLMSLTEILLTDVLNTFGDGQVPKMSFLRVLRMLRIVRVLKLMKSWKGLYKVVTTFMKVLPQMGNLFVLTFLVMVILALLGMQAFGGKYNPSTGFSAEPCPGGVCPDPELEEIPRYHFDYFAPAMSSVFVLMTGEWIDATLPAAAATGSLSLAYFLPSMIIGRFLIMNLFIGILLNAFAENEEEDDEEDQSPAPAPAPEPDVTIEPKQEAGPPQNSLQSLCHGIVVHPSFDSVMMVIIMGSSICLALDSPRNEPASTLESTLRTLDYVWTAVFVVEMSLKIAGFGFACGKNTYLSSAWNQLDFVIVAASIIVLAAEAIPQLAPLKTLRILRVLRPLRMVSRVPGMKLIITSLIKALPDVGNVFLVLFALQTVFAILGMQLFMGTFASCTDPTILTQDACHDAPPPTLAAPPPPTPAPSPEEVATSRRELKGGGGNDDAFDADTQATIWTNPRYGSFDNFGDSMRLLHIMSSGDEWEAPMYSMMDATTPGDAPVRNDFSPAAFFAIVWMFIGSFFALNLFVGVICDSFDRIKKETDSSATMTAEQQQWVKSMQAMATSKPSKGRQRPNNSLQGVFFDIVTSSTFESLIMGVIVVNMSVMACDYWGMEDNEVHVNAYKLAMHVFVNIYYVECVLKVLGLGVFGYLSDAWNRFDFFLVCTAFLDDAVLDLSEMLPLPPFLLRVLRMIRILRILRLLKSAKGLRDLIVTTILSFPSLINVGSLLGVVFFVYSVLGRNLFAFLAHQDQIDDQRNFETLGSSALLLFQVLTGDAWSAMMAEAMLTEDTGMCSAAHGNCGSPMVALVFFISFEIIGSFVFLNLVVAVILENFSSLGSLNPDVVSAADVEAFKEAWSDFDPNADNYIPSTDLPLLVLSIPPPMGLKGVANERQAVKLCLNLSLKQYEGKVAFQEVVNALTRRSFARFLESSGRDNDLNTFEALDAPPPPALPSLPVSEARPSDDKFADDMPSARRVFALKVIEKYTQNFIDKQQERQMRQASGVTASELNPALKRFATPSLKVDGATGTQRKSKSPSSGVKARSGRGGREAKL